MFRLLDYPPGFEGHPALYLATLFSMMLTVLLSLEWIWRIVWSFFEKPHELKHPATVLRIVFLLLLAGILVRICPDVWLIMRYPVLRDAERIAIQTFDARLDATSFVFMSSAWLIARLGQPFVMYQLEKQPLPVHLWPSLRSLRRPLYIGLGVFAIAFALTFLR